MVGWIIYQLGGQTRDPIYGPVLTFPLKQISCAVVVVQSRHTLLSHCLVYKVQTCCWWAHTCDLFRVWFKQWNFWGTMNIIISSNGWFKKCHILIKIKSLNLGYLPVHYSSYNSISIYKTSISIILLLLQKVVLVTLFETKCLFL